MKEYLVAGITIVGAFFAAAMLMGVGIALRVLPVIGVILAAILSWEKFASVPWALVAGFLNWFYVIYYWIAY